MFEEGFVGLGVSITFVLECSNHATLFRANMKPCVFTPEGKLLELDLEVAKSARGEGGVPWPWPWYADVGEWLVGRAQSWPGI
jgi:hypothetical protein